MNQQQLGEPLYTVDLKITGVEGFGVSLEDILTGQTPVPPEGARFDIHVAGAAESPRLKGKVRVVDYLQMRADGRKELHLHGAIETEDGARISLAGDGIAVPNGNGAEMEIRENVQLHTSASSYQWVNGLQLWGIGKANPAEGWVRIALYQA